MHFRMAAISITPQIVSYAFKSYLHARYHKFSFTSVCRRRSAVTPRERDTPETYLQQCEHHAHHQNDTITAPHRASQVRDLTSAVVRSLVLGAIFLTSSLTHSGNFPLLAIPSSNRCPYVCHLLLQIIGSLHVRLSDGHDSRPP